MNFSKLISFARFDALVYRTLFFLLVPISLGLSLHDLNNPLLEVHSWRQTQTAQTIVDFQQNGIRLMDYSSLENKGYWNFVFEFPLYQALVAQGQHLGMGLEKSARLTSLVSFYSSALAFFLLLSLFFGKTVGRWGVLIYLVLPFNVIYSRACLIDFFTLQLCLWGAWCFVKAIQSPVWGWRLGASTLLGALAGACKITIWYIPQLPLAWLGWTQTRGKKRLMLMAGLLVQGLVAMGWTVWSGHVRGLTGDGVSHMPWLVGDFSMRLSPLFWESLGRQVFVDILTPCLSVLLLALFWGKLQKKAAIFTLVAMSFLPTLFLFHVYFKHDYYFIAQMPYLIALCVLGLVKVMESQARLRFSLLVFVALLGMNEYRKLIEVRYAVFFEDTRPLLHLAQRLKEKTSPKDVVYLPQETLPSPWVNDTGLVKNALRLYSQRQILSQNRRDRFKAHGEATAWILMDQDWETLKNKNSFWMEPLTQDLTLFRTHAVGEKKLNFQKHVALFEHALAPDALELEAQETLRVNLCGSSKASQWVHVHGPVKMVKLEKLQGGQQWTLPPQPFISLPNGGRGACQYQLTSFRGAQMRS